MRGVDQEGMKCLTYATFQSFLYGFYKRAVSSTRAAIHSETLWGRERLCVLILSKRARRVFERGKAKEGDIPQPEKGVLQDV